MDLNTCLSDFDTRLAVYTNGCGALGGVSSSPGTEQEEEAEMSLVEVAVYGLASLYERPGRPATTADQQASSTK